jgi:phosphonate transport system permease protein
MMSLAGAASGRQMDRDLILRAIEIAPGVLRQPLGKRLSGPVALAIVAAVVAYCAADLRIVQQLYLGDLDRLERVLGAMFPPNPGMDPLGLLKSLSATFAMAIAGTLLGALGALPLGLLSARTVMKNGALHFVVRRVMDLFRGIPALVWALILVAAFGLGPFAGVIALALAEIPRLGKLFGEALENVDDRPAEALRATGAGWLQTLRLAVLPQVAPVWLSQCLYYLEQNFRAAAVLGIVGAGGIGFELEERIRIYAFDEVMFIVILFIVSVGVLDWLSERLRARLV